MKPDRAAVFCHADFERYPGTLLIYDGEGQPEPADRDSIHACPRSVAEEEHDTRGRPRGQPAGKPFVRRAPPGTYSAERDDLAAAMRSAGWSYTRMAACLDISDKTLWYRLQGKGRQSLETFAEVARIVGRLDLTKWANEQLRPAS
jgi:hypothetical protein